MLLFWIALGVVTLLAVGLIVLPLKTMLRQETAPARTAEQEQANLAVYQDRLDELEEDHENGRLSAEEYAQLRDELEKSLLNDLPENRKTGTNVRPARSWVLMVSAFVILPMLALGMYAGLGSYKGMSQLQWMQETRHLLAQEGDDMNAILATLKQRLEEEPQHIEGWVLLGRSYMTLEMYPEAADAFAKVATLLEFEGENPAVGYGLMAQAIYFANRGMTPGVASAVQKALAADPGESNALSIMGVAAFQEGRYQDAVKYWQTILDNNPEDPNANAIRNGINRARALAAAQGGEQSGAAEQATAAASGAEISVQVRLDEALSDAVGPDDLIFVLARPVGQRMPVAVTRIQVRDLPAQLALNDSMAMGPMAKLSSVEQVEIVARVSRSGTPQPQAGDVQGLVGPVNVQSQSEPVVITLNEVLE